jgi:hypothetical protein
LAYIFLYFGIFLLLNRNHNSRDPIKYFYIDILYPY